MDWLTDPQAWIAFFTLVALELVLGVDNVIFISILAGKLPAVQQQRARVTGLGMAVLSRILLLFSLSWIIGLSAPLFSLFGHQVSGRDVILILGGLFRECGRQTGNRRRIRSARQSTPSGDLVHYESGVFLHLSDFEPLEGTA